MAEMLLFDDAEVEEASCYLPDADAIRRGCEEIRREWDRRIEAKRRGAELPYSVPEVRVGEL